MTDRELLELAAKAAGYEFEFNHAARVLADGKLWNPLENDGDALRLANILRISIIRDSPNVQATAVLIGKRKTKIQEDVLYQCKHTATRRAIVRAAAEIGRAMP